MSGGYEECLLFDAEVLLVLASTALFRSEFHGTHNHILLTPVGALDTVLKVN
jgi:hypothetical protein